MPAQPCTRAAKRASKFAVTALARRLFAGNNAAAHAAESGQSLVEMALCLPILLSVVLGITTFGIAINNYLLLTSATDIGARQLAISRGQTLDPCALTSAAVYAAAPTMTKGSFAFVLTLNGTKYTGASCVSSSASSGAAGNLVQGATAVVTVTYPCSLIVYKTNYAPSGCVLYASTAELVQ